MSEHTLIIILIVLAIIAVLVWIFRGRMWGRRG